MWGSCFCLYVRNLKCQVILIYESFCFTTVPDK